MYRRCRLLDLATVAGMALLSNSAMVSYGYAQTAGQAAEQSYAPVVSKALHGGLILPETSSLKAPEGADSLQVTPSGLVIEGGFAELAVETGKINARLANHRVSGAELFAAAADLEKAYVRAGYILVRVSVPPQIIKDGLPLRLVITDGYVETVDVSALPERAQSRVKEILSPLEGKSGLTKSELERRLLLAGDTPGVALKSALKAGSQPSATVIVVDGSYSPVTATVAANNSMSNEVGKVTTSLGVNINNVLGLGEVTYLRLNGFPGAGADSILSEDPRNRQIVAGLMMPLNTNGLWFGLEGVDSRTHPTSDLGYTMADHYQRLSSKLGYDWIRARDKNFTSVIGFDIADELQQIDVSGSRADFTEDRLRVLRISHLGDLYMNGGGMLSGNIGASFGINAFGAREATAFLPMSRDSASPSFEKVEANLHYNQPLLGGRLVGSLGARAQTSFGAALPASEQMGLGGMNWLSAFDSSELQGDAAAMVRGELALPFAVKPYAAINATLSPYVFAAAGVAKLEQPTSLETAVTQAVSFGLGLRLALSEPASTHSAMMTLEYARGEATDIGLKKRVGLSFSVGF